MNIVNGILGENAADRAIVFSSIALPSALLAANVWLSHRPLLCTSLATIATTSSGYLLDRANESDYTEGIYIIADRFCTGAAVALTVWSACKTIASTDLTARSSWGANFLATAGYLGWAGYRFYNQKEYV
jgi:hypothetical protein